jgi:phosphoenolpyruvate phosphomutase
MMSKKKIVFVPMSCDLIHEGHINIIKNAKKYGTVIVGLLTDAAINVYKPLPVFTYKQRLSIIMNIKGVDKIEKTEDWDYSSALNRLKPDYIVHGDDWNHNNQSIVKKNVTKQMKKWNGKVIEIPYTKGISSSSVKDIIRKEVSPSFQRAGTLKRIISAMPLVKIIEAHNGLSALIGENARYRDKSFDGFWLSSLTHATSKAKPDIEYVDDTTISQSIIEIFDATTKPLILDADSGGRVEHFRFTVSNMERLGVSAIIIEDKKGSKENSLSKVNNQKQESIKDFSFKLSEAKRIQTSDMMIIARIESLIIGKGQADALKRAKAYIAAGVDGIMIHSNKKTPQEIFDFCNAYNKLKDRKPLVVVPSTYNKVKEKDLLDHGVNIVIYANHMLRAAHPAMVKVANMILKNERSYEASRDCMSIKEILELIPRN